MSESVETIVIESPPPSERPIEDVPDPRERLHQLADALKQSHDRRMLAEYLRLRRAVGSRQ